MPSWLNGQLGDTLPLSDRGLQYGDGFFTTILLVDGRMLNWSEHWKRLEKTAQRLGFPKISEQVLLDMVDNVLGAQVKLQHQCVFKIMVTRGQGGQGYQPPTAQKATPNIIMQLLPFPKIEIAKGLLHQVTQDAIPVFYARATICEIQWGIQPLLAGMKHLNRLENVLARQALLQEKKSQFNEAIMLDVNQNVISGTQANLCVIKENTLYTPNLTQSGIQGTLLTRLKPYAESIGWEWKEQTMDLNFLNSAEEVFFCNSVRGIMPVQQIKQKTLPVSKSVVLHQGIMKLLMDEACKN